jgi:outer membrane protein TolC
VAQADVDIAKTQADRARVEIAAKTKELYYTLLGLQMRKLAAQAAVNAAEERMMEGRDAADTGTALEVRVMQAQAALLEKRQAGFTIDVQIDDVLVELNELLGLPLDMELILAPAEKGPIVPSLEEAIRKATGQNPELLAAQQTVEKARHAVAAAKADRIPELGLFAQHIYQNGVPFLAPNNGVFGIRLNVNLFDWGKRTGVVKERQAQLAQAEEELHRMERRMQIDVEKAYRRIQRVNSLASVARETLRVRKEALRIVKDQFELGLCSRADFEEANAAAFSTDADLASAECQIMTAVADLDRLSGVQ